MRASLSAWAILTPALFSLASAQTWTDCNPLQKTCAPNPALSGTYEHDFKNGKAKDFDITFDSFVYNSDSVSFRVGKKLDAPTIASKFYIMFGKLEVTLRAAPGPGVVSSIVLQSDDLDEIDWEWVGAVPNEAQSNYFGKGNTETYDRGAVHPVASQDGWHTYGVDWTNDKIDWIIDGKVVRTLKYSDNPNYFPQTPCNVRIGAWAAGDPGNSPGTIQWSHGPIDYSKGPYDMVVKSIKVVDYSKGKEYVYSDKSGAWTSIKAVDGQVMAGAQGGSGNIGQITQPAPSGSIDDSGSFKAPSNSGLVSTATSTTKSKATSTTKSGSSGANSAEPTRTTSSGSSASPSSSGSASNSGTASKPTSPSSNEPTETPQPGAATSVKTPAILLGAMMMVVGLVL